MNKRVIACNEMRCPYRLVIYLTSWQRLWGISKAGLPASINPSQSPNLSHHQLDVRERHHHFDQCQGQQLWDVILVVQPAQFHLWMTLVDQMLLLILYMRWGTILMWVYTHSFSLYILHCISSIVMLSWCSLLIKCNICTTVCIQLGSASFITREKDMWHHGKPHRMSCQFYKCV